MDANRFLKEQWRKANAQAIPIKVFSRGFITLLQAALFFGGGYFLTEFFRYHANDILFTMFRDTLPQGVFPYIGWIAWLSFYVPVLMNKCWAGVKPGYRALIGEGLLTKEKAIRGDKDRDPLKPVPGVEEVGVGIYGLWPGERIIFAVHARKQIVCDEVIEVQDKNKKRFKVKYQLRLSCLIGWIINLWLVGELAGIQYFQGKIRAAIESAFADVDGDTMRKKLEEFSNSDAIKGLFGGDGIAVLIEKIFGLSSHNISIVFIENDKEITDSIVKASAMENLMGPINALIDSGITPDLAAAMVTKTPVEIIRASIGDFQDEASNQGGGRGNKRNKNRKGQNLAGHMAAGAAIK